MLSEDTIEKNMKTYTQQLAALIDLSKAEIHYNSTWLEKLGYEDIGKQANLFSLAEFIARENIKKRLDGGKRVSLREVLYPLMQGYDSVAVNADVEVGGTDQRFNLLAGRHLQAYFKQEPQDILMNPLVEGTDGRKMSSSWGNTINFFDQPQDMFGKVMSIPDSLIMKYATYFTRLPLDEVSRMGKENPRDEKIKLAHEIVRMYHGDKTAKDAEERFISVFSKKEKPQDIPQLHPSAPDIVTVLVDAKFTTSRSDARRAVEQGGVKINDVKIAEITASVKSGD